jgi:hypothetical protein
MRNILTALSITGLLAAATPAFAEEAAKPAPGAKPEAKPGEKKPADATKTPEKKPADKPGATPTEKK